jgi:uncharacterized small protein (DUF1192 family)
MRQKIIGLSLVGVLLAGCATTSDSTRTKAEGTAVGAGIGAAVGAGLGYIFGGTKGAIIGAGAGAAAGSIGGYAYGSHVANRKQEYATQEDYLDALIVSAQNVNQRTDALRQEIAQLEAETAQLVHQYNRRTIQKSQLENQESLLTKKVEEGQKQLNTLRAEIDIQQQALAQEQQVENASQEATARLDSLQAEIDRLKHNRAQLEEDVNRLAAIQIRPSA